MVFQLCPIMENTLIESVLWKIGHSARRLRGHSAPSVAASSATKLNLIGDQ